MKKFKEIGERWDNTTKQRRKKGAIYLDRKKSELIFLKWMRRKDSIRGAPKAKASGGAGIRQKRKG